MLTLVVPRVEAAEHVVDLKFAGDMVLKDTLRRDAVVSQVLHIGAERAKR